VNEKDLRKLFSSNVRELRGRLKWTQIVLAEKAGVSINFINDIESERRWISPATLIKLANALNVEAYELLKPPESFPDNFNSILKKYTDNIHAAVDEARLAFTRNEENQRKK
jgi:transcriptional regulator with XRE-family HTH domain